MVDVTRMQRAVRSAGLATLSCVLALLAPVISYADAQETGRVDATSLQHAEETLKSAGLQVDCRSLVASLRTAEDPLVLDAASQVLMEQPGEDVTKEVRDGLRVEKNPWRRRLLAEVLARRGDERGVQILESMLEQGEEAGTPEDSFEARKSIAQTLAQVGRKSGVDELCKLLAESRSVDETLSVVRALIAYRKDAATSALAPLLATSLPVGKALEVAGLLAAAGDARGYPEVVKALRHGDERSRNRAVWQLTEYLGMKAADGEVPIDVPAELVSATKDSSARVRQAALFMMAGAVARGVGGEVFLPAVRELVAKDPDIDVRASASVLENVMLHDTPENRKTLDRLRRNIQQRSDNRAGGS
jgi:hypothetical protein